MNEMKPLHRLTLAERQANRERCLEQLERTRYEFCPIVDREDSIRTLEDVAMHLDDFISEKELNEEHDTQLHGMFHDVMDILDYLKGYDNPLTNTPK